MKLRFAATRLLAAGCALAATACETVNVEKNYVLSPGSGKGVVVGSITSDGVLADYWLLYRKIGGGGRGFFRLKSPDASLNAALITVELPAGDYEIYKWAIYWPSFGTESTQVVPDAPFSIPFHVTPGQAVYLGSCAFRLVPVRRNRPFREDIDAADVVCSDQSKRDIAELEQRYPGLRNMVAQPHPGDELYRSHGFAAYQMSGSEF